jgi:hypothetical protein
VIKGALIFGAGVGVGYSLAMKQQGKNEEIKDATVDFIKTVKNIVADAHLDAKLQARKAEEQTDQTKDDTEPEVLDGEVQPPEGDTNT